MNLYETQNLLDQYLLFHYGSSSEINPLGIFNISHLNFPVRTVHENIDGSVNLHRALDLGCSVGRSAFELSAFCDEVIAIDNSKLFIESADRLRLNSNLSYQIHKEGNDFIDAVAKRPEPSRPERIKFEVGDALELPKDIGTFDVIHAANLICRLPDPNRLLLRLPNLLKKGGRLIITTPCTWLGEFTKPEKWPKHSTIEWLQDTFSNELSLIEVKDMPFVILEHYRKFQYSLAQASVWLKNDN